MSPKAPGCSTHASWTEWFRVPSSLSCPRPWARPPLIKVALNTGFPLFPWCNQHSHSKYHGDLLEGRAEHICGFSFPGMIRGIITVLGKIIKVEFAVGFSKRFEHTQAPALPEGSRGVRPPSAHRGEATNQAAVAHSDQHQLYLMLAHQTYLMLALGPSPWEGRELSTLAEGE